MKKITIVNGWHDLNSGDSAIIIGMIKQICKKEKENFEITIISELNEKNEFYNNSINYIINSFPNIKIKLIGSPFYKVYNQKKLKEMISIVKNYFLIKLPRKLFIHLVKKNKYYRCLLESDVILSKGGHFIYDREGIRGTIHLFKCLYPLMVALKIKKDYFIISQSIGPLYKERKDIASKKSYKMCEKVLKNAKKISVREEVSFENLKKLSLTSNVVNTSDYAFFMNKADSYKNCKELKDISRNDFVVITMRQHKFTQVNGEEEYIDTTIKIAEHIVKNYNCKVIFVAHVKGPNCFEDDRIIIDKIRQKTKNKMFQYVTKQYSPQELSLFYSKAKLLIGTRFHSVIFALTNGVPAIAISYSGYKANIMKQFDLDNYMIDIEDIKSENYKKICEMVDDELNNNLKFKKIILENKDRILKIIDNDNALNEALNTTDYEV